MKRGEIYFINDEPFNKNRKGEMKANHPAVIVSNDELNADANVRTVEVVYMTTKPQENLPTHIVINSALKPSTLICEQVCTVSKDRLSQIKLGQLTLKELEAMDAVLAFSLGLSEREPTEAEKWTEASKAATQLGEEVNKPEEESPEESEEPSNTEKAKELLAEYIVKLTKAEAERDVFKQLYTDLLATITKGATA